MCCLLEDFPACGTLRFKAEETSLELVADSVFHSEWMALLLTNCPAGLRNWKFRELAGVTRLWSQLQLSSDLCSAVSQARSPEADSFIHSLTASPIHPESTETQKGFPEERPLTWATNNQSIFCETPLGLAEALSLNRNIVQH